MPAAVFLVYKLLDAYAMKTGLRRNKYMEGVIDRKFTAQLPDSKGQFGNLPARDAVAVLIIGAKCNSYVLFPHR